MLTCDILSTLRRLALAREVGMAASLLWSRLSSEAWQVDMSSGKALSAKLGELAEQREGDYASRQSVVVDLKHV